MIHFATFLCGALLCNSIPHLSSGLRGMPFPTPFGRPRGVGDSPPVVNSLWGFLNMVAGLLLLSRHPVGLAPGADLAVLLAGALAMGIYLSLHFGKVRRGRR